VPEDLRELVGKREEKRSLETRDPAEAKRRHAEACQSARGPDADRHAKLLIHLAVEGSLLDAYSQCSRENDPLLWATINHNLGIALERLAGRESGTARLMEAIAAFRDALEERTRARVPLDWAATQNSLGITLASLGKRESNATQLEEAVAAYRDALKECTRARVPLEWARIQHNLALQRLGERESGTTRLEEALAAYSDALKERTRARVPLDWAGSIGNQGVVLMILAERRHAFQIAEQALAQIRAAVELYRDARHAPNGAIFEAQLSKARALVKRLRRRPKK